MLCMIGREKAMKLINRAIVMMLAVSLCAGAASVPELLGTKKALQCYQKNFDVRCRDLQSGDDWLVVKRASGTTKQGLWGGSINYDGTKFAFEDGGKVYVADIRDGGNKKSVADHLSKTTNAHFWRDDSNKDWVVYTNGPESKGFSGTTWMVQISADNSPVESSRKKIADKQYACGLGGSGVYLGETYGQSKLYNRETGKLSPNLNNPQNCNGSIHPGNKPWLMYEKDVGHQSVVISEWNESENSSRYIWEHTGAKETFGMWSSTDPEFCVLANNGKLSLAKITVDVSGSGDNKGKTVSAALNISGTSRGNCGGPWIQPSISTSIQPPHANAKLRVAVPAIQPGKSFDMLGRRTILNAAVSPGAHITVTPHGKSAENVMIINAAGRRHAALQ